MLIIALLAVVVLYVIWLKFGIYDMNSGFVPCTKYVIDDEHKLAPDTNPEDLKIVQKFNVRNECLGGSSMKEIWVEKPDPQITDSAYEKVLYCPGENKFLVLKSFGMWANFYLYEGRPCR